MSTESTTKILIRYGLNTGQIVEVNAVEYTDTVEAMQTIQWAMDRDDEKFVEHTNAMVLCESIISVEVFEVNDDTIVK